MELQFTEHNEGKKSTNPKVQKLDKLARLLKVEISIDGVKYGNIDETGPNKMVTPKDVAEKYTNTSEDASEDSEYDSSNNTATNIDADTETGTGTEVENKTYDSDVQAKTKSSTKKRGRPKKTT